LRTSLTPVTQIVNEVGGCVGEDVGCCGAYMGHNDIEKISVCTVVF